MTTSFETLVNSAINTLGVTKAIGYSITGSSILEVFDSQADTDVAIITLKEKVVSLSNIINFYLPETNNLVEILIEDVFRIETLSDSYGYSSWINYLIPRRKNIIWQEPFKNRYLTYQKLLSNYRDFWIHGMIKGYSKEIESLKTALENKDLSNNSKKELKELYHLGITYNDDFTDKARPDLVKIVKRKHLESLKDSDYDWLLEMLNDRIKTYLITDSKVETLKFNTFKERLDKVWK